MEKHRKKVHESTILLKEDGTDHWLSLKWEAISLFVSKAYYAVLNCLEIFILLVF